MQMLSAVTWGYGVSDVLRYWGLSLAITLACFGVSASAQSPASELKQPEAKMDAKPDAKPATMRPKADTLDTLYLKNATEQNELNDIQTAMRNALPYAHIYGVPTQRAIVLWATQDDIALAHRILADLDKKRPTYRLTYTISEFDGGKRIGAEHLSLVAAAGDKTEMKQGTRVPIVTGSIDSDTGKPSTQFQYVDLGLKIDATLDVSGESLTLRTKVEQSGVADEKSSVGIQDPVIRQSTLDGTSTLVPGKALVLGSLDVPGSTRREEVEVVAEAVR
jgi:type II secretory pathway component GspD/PulD (secretin)